MSTKIYKVFVYGTLKRGEPNHEWFKKDTSGYYKFLYEAETITKYPLIVSTKFNIPFLLFSPGVGNNVKGEVYEVDEKVLANLDILEDHPTFYRREEEDVKSFSDGQISKVWTYFIKGFKPGLLQQKMYTSYTDNIDGLKYVERYLRDPKDPNCRVKPEILIES